MAAPEFTSVQEACDYAVRQLVKQGKRCTRDAEGIMCAYGDGRGNHCAIGWLLDPTNQTLMEFEGGVYDLMDQLEALVPPILLTENPYIWKDLQSFHDCNTVGARQVYRDNLSAAGVDTSGDHWQQWVDLAEDLT